MINLLSLLKLFQIIHTIIQRHIKTETFNMMGMPLRNNFSTL